VLLLVTLALVVASATLLVLGFVKDALGYIYLSMVCAGVAAVALVLFARLARRRTQPRRSGPDRVGAAGDPWYPEPEADRDPAEAAASDPYPPLEPAGDELEDEDELDAAPGLVETGSMAVADDGGWDESDWGDEVVFPIEDYDELRVAEILPLLGELEPDELQEVRDRELAGKARTTVLNRIDELTGSVPERNTGSVPERNTGSVPPSKAAAGKTPTRKATAASTPAKKAPAAKTAAAKKTAAEAGPAKRAAKKASAEVAPAKRTAKRAGAEPAVAARKAAPRAAASVATEPQAGDTEPQAGPPAKKAPAKRAGTAKKAQ
jgi:hypothetical protein